MISRSSILFQTFPPDWSDADYQRRAEEQGWEGGATAAALECSMARNEQFLVSIEQLLFIEPC